MDKIMSSGFNRIVIVEDDITRVLAGAHNFNNLLQQLKTNKNKNKKEGKELVENLFDLYKENIEYIKYVNP